MMDSERFEFNWNDDEYADESNHASTPSSVEPLERWLADNYHLWELGLQLAATAQYYRREYAHIPFNKNGWFSPN